MRVEYLISRAPGLGSLSGHVLLALGQKGLWIRKARPRFLRFHETTVREGEGEEITLHRVAENLLWSEPSERVITIVEVENFGNFLNCQDKRWRYFFFFFWIYFAYMINDIRWRYTLSLVLWNFLKLFLMILKTCFTFLYVILSFLRCFRIVIPWKNWE